MQNIVSSIGVRAWLLRRRWQAVNGGTRTLELDCGDGVRLAGEYDAAVNGTDKGLVILFHGWEGSSRSAYVQSAALTLLNAAYSVFRLNFRDHGESHHLNKALFNSTLLAEVVGAVSAVQRQFPSSRYFLAGYSLGGNFALRVALQAETAGLQLDKVAAVCPVIDPAHTLWALENSRFFYQQYFVRKWRNSLLKKLDYFPEYAYANELRGLKSLRAMHDFFVPRFTGFPDRDTYFNAYRISHEQLASLSTPALIVNSCDDPITRHEALPAETENANLSIELAPYGSHCAFIEDFRMNSWIDKKLLAAFQ